MKHLLIYILFLMTPFVINAQKVVSLKIDGAINPASAAFIKDGIEKASEENAECLLIHLNTPGGLLKSTRVIVSDILSSPVPVVVYVSPSGAHAGSAGVFITMAAHVAAMAPSTNIGAAHPVGMGNNNDTIMGEKATNDAAAFIRSIAEKRNRNLEWAEEAVRKSVSITENEAKAKQVIDLVAANEQALLQLINGRQVETVRGTKTLNTAKATVEQIEMGWVENILNVISDPNVAYILMMLGFYGILFELYSPGTMVPGIVGVICLILAFYSMHTLPINYAGLALIVFGIILFILEIKITSYGLLSIGGIIALLLGSMMLIRTTPGMEMIKLSWSVIIGVTVATAVFFLFVIGYGLKAQKGQPTTGVEGLVGQLGEVTFSVADKLTVRIHGELWNAEVVNATVSTGQKVKVVAVRDLKLLVEPI